LHRQPSIAGRAVTLVAAVAALGFVFMWRASPTQSALSRVESITARAIDRFAWSLFETGGLRGQRFAVPDLDICDDELGVLDLDLAGQRLDFAVLAGPPERTYRAAARRLLPRLETALVHDGRVILDLPLDPRLAAEIDRWLSTRRPEWQPCVLELSRISTAAPVESAPVVSASSRSTAARESSTSLDERREYVLLGRDVRSWMAHRSFHEVYRIRLRDVPDRGLRGLATSGEAGPLSAAADGR
jgi:hypothetical protein